MAGAAVADAVSVEAPRLGGLIGCVIVEMGVGEGEDEYDSVCCMMSHLCCCSLALSLLLSFASVELRSCAETTLLQEVIARFLNVNASFENSP